MDNLTQSLLQQLAGGGLSNISQQLGADEKTTQSALSTALPLLVSALANNASKPAGSESLHQALVKDHDGSILDNLGGFLGNPEAANGAGILKHILGGQQPAVAQQLTQNTGLDTAQVMQLLQIAAPLVMGALGQQQKQQNLDTNSLPTFLAGEQQKAQQANPDMMSTLNSLLDFDKDGSAVNDVFGMVGKLFGGNEPSK
jgi:hypothetical protein